MRAAIPRSPGQGTSGDPGWFGPGSAAWLVNGEAVLIVGGPRALLMQVAHPAVARGVAEHSDFRRDPYERLRRTLEPMLAISFGDSAQAARAAADVRAVHERVTGTMPDGRPYWALDPGLVAWVHATLVDSAVRCFELFVRPLPTPVKNRYLAEMVRQAVALGARGSDVPSTWGEHTAYLGEVIETLRVSEEALALRDGILDPPVPAVLRPAASLVRRMTVALLPAPIADGFGLAPSPGDRLLAQMAGATLRGLLPSVPERGRRWPAARAARVRVS